MIETLQSMVVIASISILWRSTLNKKDALRVGIQKKFPIFLGTALTCGLCFTYWVTLVFVIIFSPIPANFFSFTSGFSEGLSFVFHLFFSWMFIGFGALSLRFLYALLQEGVNKLNHANGTGGHGHVHK